MDIEVDVKDHRPLYVQIAAAVRKQLTSNVPDGIQRVPTAVELAKQAGVNHNTALRALHLLRDQGLIDFRRGRGATMSACGGPDENETYAILQRVLRGALKAGYSRHNIVAILDELLASEHE